MSSGKHGLQDSVLACGAAGDGPLTPDNSFFTVDVQCRRKRAFSLSLRWSLRPTWKRASGRLQPFASGCYRHKAASQHRQLHQEPDIRLFEFTNYIKETFSAVAAFLRHFSMAASTET